MVKVNEVKEEELEEELARLAKEEASLDLILKNLEDQEIQNQKEL